MDEGRVQARRPKHTTSTPSATEEAAAESKNSSRTPSVVDEHRPVDRKQCGTPGCELPAWHQGVCQSYERVGPRQRPPSSVLFSSLLTLTLALTLALTLTLTLTQP